MKKHINKRLIIVLSIILLIGTSSIIAKTPSIDSEPIQEAITTGSAITFKKDNSLVEQKEEALKEDTRTSSEVNEILKEIIQKEPIQEAITTGSAITLGTVIFSDRVYNIRTNESIEDVTVTVLNIDNDIICETKTDQNGYFTIQVMPGEYQLTFERQGFKPVEQYITINE